MSVGIYLLGYMLFGYVLLECVVGIISRRESPFGNMSCRPPIKRCRAKDILENGRRENRDFFV
uniref:Uncharacterized protein n=1 Tax=Rhizophagus irregularis (strain DAOM 181602 / DAOM 197198 / MUCL 43194) TaxID=747089 RepID=U9U4R2_RHIID